MDMRRFDFSRVRPVRAFAPGLALILLAACGGSTPTTAEQAPRPAERGAAIAPPIEIRNARMPLHGVLTGGQPTPEQIEQAAAAGYRTIVNLRGSAEQADFEWERDKVEAAGMRYVFIDVPGAEGLTRENVERLSEVLDDPEALPMMIHCSSGNRVGAMLALEAAWIDGATADEAMRLGLDAGLTRLEDKTRELVSGR